MSELNEIQTSLNIKKLNPENLIFNHLHTHSEYSFRDAISKISAIVSRAIEIGSTAVAITDHGNMYGCVELYKECAKRNAEFEKNGDPRRIKAILGCEMYVLETEDLLNDPDRLHEKKHIIFLAKDAIGYHQIADAVTAGQLRKDKKTYPRITHEEIKKIFVGGHVICCSACVNGEIPSWIRKGDLNKAREVANFYRSVFGEDYYFEIQDHGLAMEMEYLGQLIALSKEMNIPLVATNDAHYVNKDDCETRDVVLAMRYAKLVSELEDTCKELYIKDAKEMYDLFYRWPEAIENTVKIADKCNIDGLLVEGTVTKKSIDETHQLYKIFDIPYQLELDEVTKRINNLFVTEPFNTLKITIDDTSVFGKRELQVNVDYSSKTFENDKKHDDFLDAIRDELAKIVHIKHFPAFKVPEGFSSEKEYITHLAYEGLAKKYPVNSYSKEYYDMLKERTDYELGIICDLHYEGYLLIVQDFINAGKKMGLIGPGRGSAVGSIVCYEIGITSVDPIPYSLIFERFLNKDRVSDPDIDTDFAPSIRDLVIDYVKEVYGSDAVCQIVTFGTQAAKAAIRSIGRVYAIDKTETDKVAKLVPSDVGMTLKKALDASPELKEEISKNADAKFLYEKALKLEGTVVQSGVHAAGVIIADKAVSNYCPMSYDVDKGLWITQAAKDSCEHDFGLLKMDFLGLENLNIIGRTFKDIKKNYGIEITLDDIDISNEEEVYEVINDIFVKGKTKGIFQFESDGMTSLLKRFKPRNIEDLTLLNAAYRPGPMQYIDDIIAIKNGELMATYICDDMKAILGVTFSKPIYQEQIQQIFNQVAGFSLGVADIIRRAMAKKKIKELELYLPLFKERLLEKGVTQNDIDTFCEELMDFAKYAFNKSHATAYAVVAYQTAWLKHFYPVEYMANLLNSSTTKTMPIYVNECRKMGIPVLPPDVNLSGMGFTPTKDKKILFGLKIKNAGTSGEDIIKERETNGDFSDIVDFSSRMLKAKSRCMHSNVIDAYVWSGALDRFGKTRKTMNKGIVEYVQVMKSINEMNARIDNQKQEAEQLQVIIDDICETFEPVCDTAESIYTYAKKIKKVYEEYQSAMAEDNESVINSCLYQMENIFPSMFIATLGIDEEEVYGQLYQFAIAYPQLQRKLKPAVKEDTYQVALSKLETTLGVDLPEYDKLTILDKEKEFLGFYASGHPLDGMRTFIDENATTWIGELASEEYNKEIVTVVGRVAEYKLLYRKSDRKPMCKFILEGLTGDLPCICFTRAFEESEGQIQEGSILLVTGRVNVEIERNEYGEIEDTSAELQVSSVTTTASQQRIYLRVDDMTMFNQLRPLIDKDCAGNNTLFVYFDDTKKCLQYNKKVAQYEICRQIIPEMFELEHREEN